MDGSLIVQQSLVTSMQKYQETQVGYIGMVIVLAILMVLCYSVDFTTNPIGPNSDTAALTGLIVLGLLFYRLKTTVDDKLICIAFGIGLLRDTIRMEDIVDVKVVRNPWYAGWGIRLIPHGTLYNIQGYNAIEIKFKGTRNIIRIGTPNPLRLEAEIRKRLQNLGQ